jgi:DNA-directed RNA polymerase subunit RPC12/RpoP
MAGKKRRIVRGQCPQCACWDVSFIPPKELREKYTGSEEQIEILCPACGSRIKGKLEVEGEK